MIPAVIKVKSAAKPRLAGVLSVLIKDNTTLIRTTIGNIFSIIPGRWLIKVAVVREASGP